MRHTKIVQSILLLALMGLGGRAAAQAPDVDPGDECSRSALQKIISEDGKNPENAEVYQTYLTACEQARSTKTTRKINSASFSKLLLVPGCDLKSIRDNTTLEASRLLASAQEARAVLRQAVCKWVSSPYSYEQLYGNSRSWDWDQKRLDEVQNLLGLVQNAERLGLNNGEQAFATFFEAVLNTLTAEYYRDRLQKSQTADQPAVTNGRFKGNPIDIISFCRARTAAMGNLAAIDYGSFDYLFTDSYTTNSVPNVILTKPDEKLAPRFLGLNASLSSLLSTATTGAYALAESQAVTCGDFGPIDANIKAQAITEEVTEVTEDYLGATNPATAMFQQKVELMENLKPEFTQRLDKLSSTADAVNRIYLAIDGRFQDFKRDLNGALKNYKQAYGIVYAVSDWFNRWQDGLTIPPGETVPVGHKLRNSLDAFNVELNGKPDAAEVSGLELYRTRVQKLKADLTAALNRPQAYQHATLQLCRVYYCQIQQHAQTRLRLQNGCVSSTTYRESPICSKDKVYSVGTTIQSLRELCTQAGLEEKFMATTLAAGDANACAAKLLEDTRT